MKSFLVRNKKPICKWGKLPNEIYYEGEIPEGYSLAVSPWGYDGYIVIDVDKHGDTNGFDNIPPELLDELNSTLNYPTKNNGRHYWFKYSGNEYLGNKSSNDNLGIDLRTNKGYVVYYPANQGDDIRNYINEINKTSLELNKWIEKQFGYKNKINKNGKVNK